MHKELAQTLLELLDAVRVPAQSELSVTEVEIELPLEVTLGKRDGRPIFLARPPHTRWKSGVLPPVNVTRLRIAREEA
jgi:hypothetical protein